MPRQITDHTFVRGGPLEVARGETSSLLYEHVCLRCFGYYDDHAGALPPVPPLASRKATVRVTEVRQGEPRVFPEEVPMCRTEHCRACACHRVERENVVLRQALDTIKADAIRIIDEIDKDDRKYALRWLRAKADAIVDHVRHAQDCTETRNAD